MKKPINKKKQSLNIEMEKEPLL